MASSGNGQDFLIYREDGPSLSNVYCYHQNGDHLEPLRVLDFYNLSGAAYPGLFGALSPDGQWVIVSFFTDTGEFISHLGRCDGTLNTDLVPLITFSFSPHSRWLAGQELSGGTPQLWLYSLADLNTASLPIDDQSMYGGQNYVWIESEPADGKPETEATAPAGETPGTESTPPVETPQVPPLETAPPPLATPAAPDPLSQAPTNLSSLTDTSALGGFQIFAAVMVTLAATLMFAAFIFSQHSGRLYLHPATRYSRRGWLAGVVVAALASGVGLLAVRFIPGYGPAGAFANSVLGWSSVMLLNGLVQRWLLNRGSSRGAGWLEITLLAVGTGWLVTLALGLHLRIGPIFDAGGAAGGLVAWLLLGLGEAGLLLRRPRQANVAVVVTAFLASRVAGLAAGCVTGFLTGDYLLFGGWSFLFYWPVMLFCSELVGASVVFWAMHRFAMPRWLSWSLANLAGAIVGLSLYFLVHNTIWEELPLRFSNLEVDLLAVGLAQGLYLRGQVPLRWWGLFSVVTAAIAVAAFNLLPEDPYVLAVLGLWLAGWMVQGLLLRRYAAIRWWTWWLVNLVGWVAGMFLSNLLTVDVLDRLSDRLLSQDILENILLVQATFLLYAVQATLTGVLFFRRGAQPALARVSLSGNSRAFKVFRVPVGLVLLGVVVSAGYVFLRPLTLPVYQINLRASQNSDFKVTVLSLGEKVYVNDLPEFSLDLLGAEPGWDHQIGRTNDNRKIYAIPQQDSREYIVVLDDLFGNLVFRGASVVPAVPYEFYVGELRLSEYSDVDSPPRSLRDSSVSAEVIACLVHREGITEGTKITRSANLHLISDDLPGLGYFVKVYVGTDGRVFLAERLTPDDWIPAGPGFTSWFQQLAAETD